MRHQEMLTPVFSTYGSLPPSPETRFYLFHYVEYGEDCV